MPSVVEFKRGFGVQKGALTLGGYGLARITMGHETVTQNERYRFPTTMVFEPAGASAHSGSKGTQEGEGEGRGRGGGSACVAPQELLRLLKEHVSGERIIYSQYGSPYACTFGKPALQAARAAAAAGGAPGAVVIASCGSAVRRRDVPTLSQQRERKQLAQAQARGDAAAVEAARAAAGALEAAAEAAGYRVIKSRFGSSKCGGCGEVIESGEPIAKPKAAAGRGGWRHLACCGVSAAVAGAPGAAGGGGGRSGHGGGEGRKRARHGGTAGAPDSRDVPACQAKSGGTKKKKTKRAHD